MFSVFSKTERYDAADTITDFTTATGTATTDEIHLKGFDAGVTVTVGLVPGQCHACGELMVDGVPSCL